MKLTEISLPDSNFIYCAIHLISNRLQTLGDKIDPAISSKQWLVLAAVSKFGEAPPNIGDVAQLMGTSRQNIKKMAYILEQRGYLQLKKDKKDLRNTQLYLTESCHDYFKSREQQEDEYFEKVFSGLNPDVLNVLHEGLQKLMENIDGILENDENTER